MDTIARRVTLRELRLLLAVARSGSILKAAEEIGLTQPAVSKAIADLEGTLGVRLFDRTNRGVEPTPSGRIMLIRAAGVFQELRQAAEDLACLAGSTSGELHVGGMPGMCGGLLPHAIAAMDGELPGIRYHVVELETQQLATEVRSRVLDFGVGRVPAPFAEDITFERLFEDRLFIVAGAQHPLARRRTISLEETLDQQWVLPMHQTPVSEQLQSALKQFEAGLPKSIVSTTSMLIRHELVATNRFLTVLHGSLLQFRSMPSSLRVLPIELSTGIPIGLIKVKNRTLTPVAEMFMKRVRKIVQPMRSLTARQLQRALCSRPSNIIA